MKPDPDGTFVVDELNSDDKYLFVDAKGKGTVVIKNEEEGIVVDIYPLSVTDEPVASTWAHNNDLMEDNDE